MGERKTTVAKCGPETFAGSLRTARSGGRKLSDIIGDICDESLKKIMDRQAIAIIEITKRIDNDKIYSFKISDTIQCGFKGIDCEGKENPFCATYINDERHNDDNEWSEYGKGMIDGMKASFDHSTIITRYEKKNGDYAFEKCVFDFQKMGLENIHSPECTSITKEFYRENHPYDTGSSIICNIPLANVFKRNYSDIVNDVRSILTSKYSSCLLHGNVDYPEDSRLKLKYTKNNEIIEEPIIPIPSYIENENHPYPKFYATMDVRENDRGETTILVKRNWKGKWHYWSKDNNKYRAFPSKASYESKIQEYPNKIGEFIMAGTRTSGVEQKNDKNEPMLPKSSIVMKRHRRPLTISIHIGGRHMSFIKCANEHNHQYFELTWKNKSLTKLIENNHRKIIDCDLTRINKEMVEAGKWCQTAIRSQIKTETNFKKEWLKTYGIEWDINKSHSENMESVNNQAVATDEEEKSNQNSDVSGTSDVSEVDGSVSEASDVSEASYVSHVASDVSEASDVSDNGDVSHENASDHDNTSDDNEEKQSVGINPSHHIPQHVIRAETSSSIGNPLNITIELLRSLKNKDLSNEEDTVARFGDSSKNIKGLRSIYMEILDEKNVYTHTNLKLIKHLAFYEYYTYKEWIHDIELMLNHIYKDRDEDSELPVQGGTDISRIVNLVNTMYDNRVNQNTNETIA